MQWQTQTQGPVGRFKEGRLNTESTDPAPRPAWTEVTSLEWPRKVREGWGCLESQSLTVVSVEADRKARWLETR